MKQLAIYGAGALAKRIIAYNSRYHLYDIVVLIDDDDSLVSFEYAPYLKVLSYDSFKASYPPKSGVKVVVSVGYTHCNTTREAVINILKNDGYSLANFISSGSNCWEGTYDQDSSIIVFDNVFVGVGSHISEGTIITEGSVLSHDIHIGKCCYISDAVVFGGNASIGHNTFIGLNSTIKSGIVIGNYNIIGSGTNIIHNSDNYCVIKGNPGISKLVDTINLKI